MLPAFVIPAAIIGIRIAPYVVSAALAARRVSPQILRIAQANGKVAIGVARAFTIKSSQASARIIDKLSSRASYAVVTKPRGLVKDSNATDMIKQLEEQLKISAPQVYNQQVMIETSLKMRNLWKSGALK